MDSRSLAPVRCGKAPCDGVLTGINWAFDDVRVYEVGRPSGAASQMKVRSSFLLKIASVCLNAGRIAAALVLLVIWTHRTVQWAVRLPESTALLLVKESYLLFLVHLFLLCKFYLKRLRSFMGHLLLAFG